MSEPNQSKSGRPIKLLHLIETLGCGGAERLLFTNLKHLNHIGFESEVVTVFSKNDFWKSRIEELGVNVFSLECGGPADILTGASRLRKRISGSKPDLIHTHLWTANIVGRIAGRLTGTPVVSSIHNPEYEPEALTDSTGIDRRKLFAARQLDKWTARFGCKRMIAVSQYVRDSTVKRLGYPRNKIDVVYNPVDNVDDEDNISKGEIRTSIGLHPESPILLNVGRLAPQKGFLYAVRAMPAILKQFPNTSLLSVGAQSDSRYLDDVRSKIADLGIQDSVRLLGERRDVNELLVAADVFVFPSLFEGLGIALTEAMMFGKACIASNIRPLTEFIDNGVNGILVEARDPSEIAAAAIQLLSSPDERSKIGVRARSTIRENFLPGPATGKLAALYLDVLAGS